MAEFRDFLLQIGVFDLRFNEPLHTWTNSKSDTLIANKLDWTLINSHFISAYPNVFASFLPPFPSDHSPCLTDLSFQLPQAGTKPFRFLNYLTKHPTFLMVVSQAWAQDGTSSTTLKDLCLKLKCIKNDLKTLNKQNYSNIQKEC